MPSFDTVVIGGGVAGISAAVALSNAGRRIALLESEASLGGRAVSFVDEVTGDRLAVGPHVLFSEYVNLLRLLRALNTADRIVWDDFRFSTEVKGTNEIVTRMSRLPAPFHFVPSLIADPTLRNRDWFSNAAVTLFVLAHSDDELRAFDDVTAIDVLRRLHVTEAYIDRFWRYASLAIMNVPLEACSAAAILRAYRRLIGKRGYRIGFPSRSLGELFAPAEQYLKEHRSLVRTGARVTAIEGGYRISVADGEPVDAASCIVALPPHALHALLPPDWKTGELATLGAFRSVPYASVYLWFDRKLTGLRFWSRQYDEQDLNLDFYDFSNIETGHSASLIGSNVIGPDRIDGLTDEEIVTRTLDELAEFLPEARNAALRHSVVRRIPMAIHAPLPGSERLRPMQLEPRKGFILAGDWVQTGLPASMESACFSGFRAAETVLGTRGIAVRHRELDSFARLLGSVIRRARRIAR